MIEINNQDVLIERVPAPKNHKLSLLKDIYVERGTVEDWNLLHELHYKVGDNGIGPRFWRCVLDGQTIGVGVMTVPKILLSGRNKVFPHLKPNTGGMDTRMINRTRANWLNRNSCVNSRLVLDTMFRGAGIAYRMQNIMMRMTGCEMVEFQSSMSKFNPFAAKAGIKFVSPMRAAKYEKGVEFFRRWFESNPADTVGVVREIEAMRPAIAAACVAEMRKFYYASSALEKTGNAAAKGVERSETMPVVDLVKSLQQLVLASPLYGVYKNPDVSPVKGQSVLPDQVPILAFDNQPTDAPLNLSES